MTKLSDVGVHEIRCWIVLSSSMLLPTSQHQKAGRGGQRRKHSVGPAYLYSLWMKAV